MYGDLYCDAPLQRQEHSEVVERGVGDLIKRENLFCKNFDGRDGGDSDIYRKRR